MSVTARLVRTQLLRLLPVVALALLIAAGGGDLHLGQALRAHGDGKFGELLMDNLRVPS